MIIDDSEIVLEHTRAVLEGEGYEVITRDTPIGAALMAAQTMPSIVLVDLEMASLGGERVIAGLKSGTRTASIPVVIYSDRPESELRSAASRAGADGFVRKTGQSAALVSTIRRLART